MTLTVHFEPLPDLAVLAPRWQALEAASDASFFLGWTWMGSWLGSTGARPELMSVREGARDVALALVGRSMERRKFGSVPTLHLNEAGEARADRAFIEYNGLLVAAKEREAASRAVMSALLARKDWRALKLSGMAPGDPLLFQGTVRRRVLRDVSPVYYIDLNAVRAAGGDYLSLLSANSRSQIRRSFKDHGEAQISQATDSAQIDAWLTDMARLNRGRHADNAWDDEGFRAFARTIALNGLPTGDVELLRVDCGGALTGYLLNFVWRGRAMNYQSAFVEPAGPKSKPGLMCHAAAARRYAELGHAEYSLLAGKDRYKQSLATNQEELQWWTMERFSPTLELEALARKLIRRTRNPHNATS